MGKIEFTGFPDYLNNEIKEEKEEAQSKKNPFEGINGAMFQFKIPPEIMNLLNKDPNSDEITPEEEKQMRDFLGKLSSGTGIGGHGLDAFLSQLANQLLNELGPSDDDGDDENYDDNDYDESDLDTSEEDFDTLVARAAGKPTKKKVSIYNSQSFVTLKNNPKLQYPCLIKGKNIEGNFFQEFGKKDSYSVQIFSGSGLEILSFDDGNDTDIFDKVNNLIFLESTDKYMLFRATTANPDEESFVIAISEEVMTEDEGFVVYIPRYGNSIISEGNRIDLIRKDMDPELFDELGNLKKIANIDKIKAECDLVLIADEKPITSVSEFGRILQVHKATNSGGDSILIGTIHSNDSYKAKQAIKDFGFDSDKKKFNFYVQLDTYCDRVTLNYLSDFLSGFDFNENIAIQTADIMKVEDGFGIKMNLRELEDNIKNWKEEE